MSGARRASVVALALVVVFAVCGPLFAQHSSPAKGEQIVKLPDGPAPSGADAAKSATQTASEKKAALAAGESAPAGRSIRIATLPELPADSTSPDVLLERGLNCLAARDLVGAKALLSQAAEAADTYAGGRAGIQLALLLHWDGRHDEADALTLRVSTTAPDAEIRALAVTVGEAQAAARQGDFQAAADRYGAFAREWHGTQSGAWAGIQEGTLHRDDLHNPEAARAVYAQVAQDYAGTSAEAEALVEIGNCLRWSEKGFEEAISVLQAALDRATTRAVQMDAAYGIAACYVSMGEPAVAYDALTACVAAFPEAHFILERRAELAWQLGDGEAAAQDAAAFLQLSGGGAGQQYDEAHIMIGQMAFRRGELDEAERNFAAAAEGKPESRARALAAIAYCRSARGDLRGAISAFLDAAAAPQPPPSEGMRMQGKDLYLYDAAVAASQLGDSATVNMIAARMVAECPGSYLTTRLVGYEVLPAPDL